MVRTAIVFQDTKGLDFEKLPELFHHVFENLKFDASSVLYIILLDKFDSSSYLDRVLGKLYSIARDVLLSGGQYMIQINILFGQFSLNQFTLDWLFVPSKGLAESFIYSNVQIFEVPTSKVSSDLHGAHLKDHNKYAVSALGGTFDHIHDGHKILLSIAAFLTSSKLIVGVTDQDLLLKKKYKEYLESFESRCQNVQKFLALLKPMLQVEIVPIKDVCGPTGTVPEIECLVVSRETVSGGEFVNKTRVEKGLSKLAISVVNVLGGNEDDGWKEKLSSTELRRMIKNNEG